MSKIGSVEQEVNVRTPTIRSLLVLLAALATLIGFENFTQTRKPALVVRFSKLPTPITNGLFEFSVTASNASSSDMFIGNIQLQNNSVVDLSPHRIPSTVSMGDADVAPGTTLTRVGWSAFLNGAKDRIFIAYIRLPGPRQERLLDRLGQVPFLKTVFHLPKVQYGVTEWFEAPLNKRDGSFNGFGAFTPPIDPTNLAKLNLP